MRSSNGSSSFAGAGVGDGHHRRVRGERIDAVPPPRAVQLEPRARAHDPLRAPAEPHLDPRPRERLSCGQVDRLAQRALVKADVARVAVLRSSPVRNTNAAQRRRGLIGPDR